MDLQPIQIKILVFVEQALMPANRNVDIYNDNCYIPLLNKITRNSGEKTSLMPNKGKQGKQKWKIKC